MIRYNSPYNGKRYLLNKNTGEIHDLKFETNQCHIDSINLDHIYTSDTYEDCQVEQVFSDSHADPNDCLYCLPIKHID